MCEVVGVKQHESNDSGGETEEYDSDVTVWEEEVVYLSDASSVLEMRGEDEMREAEEDEECWRECRNPGTDIMCPHGRFGCSQCQRIGGRERDSLCGNCRVVEMMATE